MASYLRPTELDAALDALAARPRVVLAGGTDYFPARVGRPLDDDVLDITALPGLRRIEETEDGWRIPALATWTDHVETRLPPWFDGLKAAAREIGGVQIQNAGTICGNLCNASPAADGIPNLLALDAAVELAGAAGARTLTVAEFVLGNRATARRPDELVLAIRLPRPRAGARAVFLKLGARRYLVISIAMVAAVLEIEGGVVGRARIAVGACGPVACRLPGLEAALAGAPPTPKLVAIAQPIHLQPLAPIDDVRGTAAYRADAALTLVRHALLRLVAELQA